jgi:hypothetical protein
VRGRVLGSSLLLLLVICTLLPFFLGVNAPVPPALGLNGSPPPPGNPLNATGFSIRYQWSETPPQGNSSLLDVIVQRVNASDIGECKTGDLLTHKFRVKLSVNSSKVFEDDLQYNGTMWVAINYSLLPHSNMTTGWQYKVDCYFERLGTALWNTTTPLSEAFTYQHRLLIAQPTYTYPTNTSDTIDVFVSYIRSSIWGRLNSTSWTYVTFMFSNATFAKEYENVLSYNATLDRWSADELNISALASGKQYYIRITATYLIRAPLHSGTSPNSVIFTFRGPYLTVSTPEINYLGRSVQLLNVTVSSVWCSIHGYLTSANVTFGNYTITRLGTNTPLVDGILLWDGSAGIWYAWNVNISYYIQQNILHIGEEYHIRARFNSTSTARHGILNATSLFSVPFILDRTPPNVTRTFVNPSPPTDEDQVYVSCELSDDARIGIAILSYYNGSHWVNMSMSGAGGKLANYTAILPAFPERTVVSYRVYVNDSQNAWLKSSIFTYTVADTPPLIAHISFLPVLPTTVQSVVVSVNITDGTAVSTVTLYYSFGSGVFTSVTMVHKDGNRYEAVIPAYSVPLSTLQFEPVLFRIEAADIYGNTRTSDDYAYLVRGVLPAIDPAAGLFIVSVIALAVIAVIILVKIYERY